MKFDEIERHIASQCDAHGVQYFRSTESAVFTKDSDVPSNGYFTESGVDGVPLLAVATNDHMLEILIHEYSHMMQWLRQDDAWIGLTNRSQLWEWLDGYEVDTDTLDESFLAHIQVEFECEVAAVTMHLKFDTGIDIEEYIQRSNAYLLFYYFVRQHRKWYSMGKEPYSIESVWRNMPTTYDFDFTDWYMEHGNIFTVCVD